MNSAQKLKWHRHQVKKLESYPSPKRHLSLFSKCLKTWTRTLCLAYVFKKAKTANNCRLVLVLIFHAKWSRIYLKYRTYLCTEINLVNYHYYQSFIPWIQISLFLKTRHPNSLGYLFYSTMTSSIALPTNLWVRTVWAWCTPTPWWKKSAATKPQLRQLV